MVKHGAGCPENQIFLTCTIELGIDGEFCIIATSRETATGRSHGRKPMVLKPYVAEVPKGRYARSLKAILLRNLGPGLAPAGSRNRKVSAIKLMPNGYILSSVRD